MERLTVVKVGGAVVEETIALNALLREFVRLEGKKILVHGGGRRATKLLDALGIKSRMIAGRRITDEASLKVVTMVYGGEVNKNIVARLAALGVNALGLTGADLQLIRAEKRPPTTIRNEAGVLEEVDFGFVGDIKKVNNVAFVRLLEQGFTPVVAPITYDDKGHLLNTNADTIAGAVAQALAKVYDVALVYAFEKNGVLRDENDPHSLIPTITYADFEQLLADGIVSGGMVAKVENALYAVAEGVEEVRITHFGDLAGGTTIV